MRLQGALDNEILVATRKFLADGVPPDVDSLWAALQKSNSSLKRRPKKVLQGSLERVLDFIGPKETRAPPSDSDAEIEQREVNEPPDIMNRSLRANLRPADAMDTGTSSPALSNDDGDLSTRRRRQPNGESLPKRQKPEPKPLPSAPTEVSVHDLGGMDDVLRQMKQLLVRPLLFSSSYNRINAPSAKGILLHGPPGCGKTMLSRACAARLGLPFVEILGPSVVSGMSGESERAIREKFDEAKRNAPCIIFLDEIDAIAPKRENSQSQMEKRIVAQMLVSMDDLDRDRTKPVIVLATTNRPDAIDPALRRGGRFDTEINIPVPNEQVREQILKAQTRDVPMHANVDFKKLAKMTAGFVGSDLHDFVGKATSWQMDKYFDALEAQSRDLGLVPSLNCMDIDSPSSTTTKVSSTAAQEIDLLVARASRPDLPEPAGFEDITITMSAFLAVLPHITPSSKREGFATVPDVSWEDIGALKSVREELQMAIVEPIKNPELYASVGISAPAGVLLWGPPGCGKTLLAKACAAESRANFISIKGPELLNKFVGESEAAVRRVFTRARSSIPCVIFFDELDALVPKRDDSLSESSARVVNTLLTELDGLSERQGIFVIGATNRPDIIDEAMLRPGRLETPLFVDLPGPEERGEILRALIRSKPVDEPERIVELARTESCNGYSGADLGALVRQAGQAAIRRMTLGKTVGERGALSLEDFVEAAAKVKGSVNDMQKYYRLKKKFSMKS